MSLSLTSKARRLLLSQMAFRMMGPPSLPKPLHPSHNRWMTCTHRDMLLTMLPFLSLQGLGHLADAHSFHQAHRGLKLGIPFAFDVEAKLRAVHAKFLQRQRRDDCAGEGSAYYSIENIGVGINCGVANIKNFQWQTVFDSPGD
jgi:hypothetical protein